MTSFTIFCERLHYVFFFTTLRLMTTVWSLHIPFLFLFSIASVVLSRSTPLDLTTALRLRPTRTSTCSVSSANLIWYLLDHLHLSWYLSILRNVLNFRFREWNLWDFSRSVMSTCCDIPTLHRSYRAHTIIMDLSWSERHFNLIDMIWSLH